MLHKAYWKWRNVNVRKTRGAVAKTFGYRNCRIRSGMEDSVKTAGTLCTVARHSFQEHGQEASHSVEMKFASLWRRFKQPVALILKPS